MIRVVGTSRPPELAKMVEEELSPEELAESRRKRAIFERNIGWYDTHWSEIVGRFRGRHICIAGGEVFAGDDPVEVRARSAVAHPDEAGCQFAVYLRPEREVPAA